MTVLGQLTDLHLDGGVKRQARLLRGLLTARAAGCEHLVITGDVTASAQRPQLAQLYETLSAHWPRGVTVVPGNHDLGLAAGWTLDPVTLPGCVVFPLDTRVPARGIAFGALGRMGREGFERLERKTRSGKLTVVAMHHGPQEQPLQAMQGLLDRECLVELLEERPWVHVLCGHDHRAADYGRVHVAAATAHHPRPLRVYQAHHGRFEPRET